MKKYISFFIIIFIIAAMAGVTGYALTDSRTVSETEQRVLSKKPELTFGSWMDGTFQADFSNYFSDHVYGRDRLISIAQKFEDSLKLPGKNLILKDVTGNDNVNENNEPENMILGDRIVPLYSHSDENLVYFFESNNALFQIVPEGIKNYLMICPGRIEYEDPDVREYSDSAKPDMELVYDNMEQSVTCVPVFESVGKGVEENGIGEIYFRTDHHWTMLGAYYAAQEFLKAAGKEPIRLEDYERKQGNDFQGYLTVKNKKESEYEPDQLYYYEPKDGAVCQTEIYWKSEDTGQIELHRETAVDPYRGGYYTFIESSQFAYAVIDGVETDGSCLIVVSDSYGLALSTWLMERYDTIVVVDPRYYEGVDIYFAQLFEKYKATDFLLCLHAEEMHVPLFHIKMMENLLGVKQ